KGRIFGSRGGDSRWSRLFHVPLRLSRFSLSSRLETKPTSRCRLTTSTIGVEPHRPVPKTTTSIRRMPSQPCVPGYLSIAARSADACVELLTKKGAPPRQYRRSARKGGREAGPGACRAPDTSLHRGCSPSGDRPQCRQYRAVWCRTASPRENPREAGLPGFARNGRRTGRGRANGRKLHW